MTEEILCFVWCVAAIGTVNGIIDWAFDTLWELAPEGPTRIVEVYDPKHEGDIPPW